MIKCLIIFLVIFTFSRVQGLLEPLPKIALENDPILNTIIKKIEETLNKTYDISNYNKNDINDKAIHSINITKKFIKDKKLQSMNEAKEMLEDFRISNVSSCFRIHDVYDEYADTLINITIDCTKKQSEIDMKHIIYFNKTIESVFLREVPETISKVKDMIKECSDNTILRMRKITADNCRDKIVKGFPDLSLHEQLRSQVLHLVRQMSSVPLSMTQCRAELNAEYILELDRYLKKHRENLEQCVKEEQLKPTKNSTKLSATATTSKPELSPTKSNPEITAPTSTPEVAVPASNPDIVAPTTNPDIVAPATNPEVAVPVSNPEIAAPATNPEEAVPVSNPEIAAPATNPEEAVPVSNPEIAAPATNPEEAVPASDPEVAAVTINPEVATATFTPEIAVTVAEVIYTTANSVIDGNTFETTAGVPSDIASNIDITTSATLLDENTNLEAIPSEVVSSEFNDNVALGPPSSL